MPDVPVGRAEWISVPAANYQHAMTCRVRFNTSSSTIDGRRQRVEQRLKTVNTRRVNVYT